MDWASAHWRESVEGGGEVPDGIFYPEQIAKLGAEIYRRSNYTIIPDPRALAAIDPLWKATLDTLDNLIEKAKPSDD